MPTSPAPTTDFLAARGGRLRLRAQLFCVAAIVLFCPAGLRAQDSRDKDNQLLALRLVETVRDRDGRYSRQARVAAARTLGEMGVDARWVVPQLMEALGELSRGYPLQVSEALVEAIGKIGNPARVAIPALVRNSGIDRDLDRTIAASVDRILFSAAIPLHVEALIRLLSDPDPAERLKAGKQLASLGADARAALPALTDALSDPDPDVRRQALQALRAIQPGAAPTQPHLNVFVRDLTDPDPAIRLRAAKALGLAGRAARFALRALQTAARSDADEDVRRVAGDAVARIQGP